MRAVNEPVWPEPIVATSDDAAAAMIRQLWSRAGRIDAWVADANRLQVLVAEYGSDNGPRPVRIITGTLPTTDSSSWHYSVSKRAPGPEFILFYPAGSAFPESALIFTGGMDVDGWVTFHRRPLVLQRLRERFNSLFVAQHPLAMAASVREQPPFASPHTAAPRTVQHQVVSPAELYHRVLAAHFSGIQHNGTDSARPESAPVLATHQERAYERARDILDRYGGLIVADAVGLGKTYIGLRLLERCLASGRRALVIVPAALRDQWERELSYLVVDSTRMPARQGATSQGPEDDNLDLWVRESGNTVLVSMESLGRRGVDLSLYKGADLVLVDEAHNFRTPTTRRYRKLADLARHSKIVLLTATPINNTILDLQHLLDLFAAPSAFRHLGISDYREAFRRAAAGEGDVRPIITACVLRRTRRFLKAHYGTVTLRDPATGRETELRFPKRRSPIAVDYDLAATYGGLFANFEEWLGALQFPCINPHQGDVESDTELACSAELLKIILLKRLESSVESFRCTVIQQLAWCNTALGAIKSGRVLTRPDYRATFKGPDDDPGSQLAFFELMLPAPSIDVAQIEKFRKALEHDMSILARVHTALSTVGVAGDLKLRKLIDLLDGPLADRKVLVFTEFRDTARYLYHALKQRPYLAQIDSDRARLGLEPAARREVIERFAPLSNNLPPPPSRERVDLLIATDVLSEGLNLQDASVVVSYDLPWNPVRLMQRIGRIDRLGALADVVDLYHFVPADVLDRLLGLMSRLHRKVGTINTTLGLDHPVLAPSAIRDRASEQIRALARDPDGFQELELEVEGPFDPEEQAYIDYVEISDSSSFSQSTCVTAIATERQRRSGQRAVSYWRASSGGQSRGLWLVCDLDSGCVVEDQAAAIETLRSACTSPVKQPPKGPLAKTRRACERYARSIVASLEAARIAGDALNPSLPQCRIAAWLSRSLQASIHRLRPEQRAAIDHLLDRLAHRFTVASERRLVQLLEELPESFDPDFLHRIEDHLRPCEPETREPATLEEVATLLII